MASGKKGKKPKGKTLAWNEFLQEAGGVAPPVRSTISSNWADEVDDSFEAYENASRPKPNIVLPTAPKAARGLEDYSDRVPHNPPYTAYLSNIPYDVDEEEIAQLFGGFRIASMNIPKDNRPGEMSKLKGFGYVDFEDRESLLGALAIPDCTLKNRRIRIEVSTNSDNDRKRGGRMDMGRDRPERPEVSMGDWRSGNNRNEIENDRERRGFNRDRDRDRNGGGGGFERSGGSGFERSGGSGFERSGGSSGAWRDSSDRPSFERSRDTRPFDREERREGGGGRFGGDREERRGFGDDRRGGFGGDREERRGFGPRSDSRNGGMPRREDAGENENRARPKLNLKPRTKPLEEVAAPPVTAEEKQPEKAAAPAPAPVPAASIFGSAKPVDTSARERQIEERLAKEQTKATELRRDDRKRTDDDSTRRIPRRESPPQRKLSPRRESPSTSPPRERSGDRHVDRSQPPPSKEDRPKRDERRAEKEMPKHKDPEPQNFVASNKYASLEADLSD